MCISLPTPLSLDYCNRFKLNRLILFSKIVVDILVPMSCHITFRIILTIVTKKSFCDFVGNIKLANQVGGTEYTESSLH